MREGVSRRDYSPPRPGIFGELRAASALHDRSGPDVRREGLLGSPQLSRESPHSFRAFRPDAQEPRSALNGIGGLARPNSQPLDPLGPHAVEEMLRRPIPGDDRLGTFRHFTELPRSDTTPRQEAHAFQNGVTSQPRERDVFSSPSMDRDGRSGVAGFRPSSFGTPMREEQAGLFRPVYQHAAEAAHESIESRPPYDMRREIPRSSPALSDFPPYDRRNNSFMDRPMNLEEHQRFDAMQREQQRKESDGSAHRALLNISPELDRRGRGSPLPQAVQGAQPRPVGPGGNNPGIKMEFSRMFSGLGSGAGSATPTMGHSLYGHTTPSRMSPITHLEDGDLVRTAVAGIEDNKNGIKKVGKRNGRSARDDVEKTMDLDGRATPDSQRGIKRAKTTHPNHHHHHHVHPHHHHHHYHEGAEAQPSPFNMLRFPSNPDAALSTASSNPTHHHHHHHTTHAHPSHHHHHHAPPPAPLPRKPTTTVISQRLVEEVAKKPRKHLGSRLYTTDLSVPSAADAPRDAKIKFNSEMKAIPRFEGKENCTYTVRVPRSYLVTSQTTAASNEPSALEEICRRRQLWGTDVYTDDSDVVAAAVHSGWLEGDFGQSMEAIHELFDDDAEVADAEDADEVPMTLTSRPRKPVKPPPDHDAHITLLVLPPLDSYVGTTQQYVRSREWEKTHDGMSFMIHRVDFVDEGPGGRYIERTIQARKQRIALEEQQRREAASALLMFSNGTGGRAVRVGA